MKGEVHKNLLAAQIQILSLIKNRPNLLDVHKICSDKNKTYIITDYCQGGDLAKIIKARKRLPEQDALKILKQIIKGYESLYALGIVHRDLKPANIFFHSGQLEIGDFGFAVRQQNLRTVEKYNVGSPVYMPPEALNYNQYSHKSDIWAIGVIFYEMLAGVTPWTGKTEAELKAKIKTTSIRNIIPTNISKSSSSFLRRALEVETAKRMEPYEMFDHFQVSHEHDTFPEDIYLNQPTNKLFRSMRKPARSQIFNETRGQSLKKPTNTLQKKQGSIHTDNLYNTGQYPRSSMDQTLKPSAPPRSFMEQTLKPGAPPRTAMQQQAPKQSSCTLPKTATSPKQHFSLQQKRTVSKQLLSQVHFCRFLFKLLSSIQSGISIHISATLKQRLSSLLFFKLHQTRQLRLVPLSMLQQYINFQDCRKLQKLVDQYICKYCKKLQYTQQPSQTHNYTQTINQLRNEAKQIYTQINASNEPQLMLKQIIVLDYMITLSQLVEIMGAGVNEFHCKSKIQDIVDGECIVQVSAQHVRLIGNKLRMLRVL